MTTNDETQALMGSVTELAVMTRALGGDVRSLKSTLDTQKRDYARTKRVLRLAIVGLCFDVCLSFGLGFVGIRAQHAAHDAAKSSSARKVNCLSVNQTKAVDKEVWERIFLFPQPQQTPDQIRQTEVFKAYLNEKFKPNDCSKI